MAGLVRVRQDERDCPMIEPLGEASLRGILARTANFVVERDERYRDVSPPMDVVKDILTLGAWGCPSLVGITETPLLRPDGTILDTPGYDPATRFIYAPLPNFALPTMPASPTKQEIKGALSMLLGEALRNFPFADKASRANALGALLTLVLRAAIHGNVPLGLIDKPTMGTGASLLADLIALVATGRPAAMMSTPKDDEEWRKQITAALDMGSSLVVIDNVEDTLRSASLARALTSSTWKDRRLGRTEMLELPQRAVWLATGINIRLGGDLPRRCYWIRMDAKLARPWQRTGFRHPDLLGWAAEHRGELVAATLTLARAWFVAGKPKAEVPTLGGFDAWAQAVGSILAHAGVTGFLSNLQALYELADDETAQWEAFFDLWWRLYGETPLTVAALIKGVNDGVAIDEALPDSLTDGWDGHPGSLSRRLGKGLAKRNHTVIGAYRVESLKRDAANTTRWRVVKLGQPAPMAEPDVVDGFNPL
jgi:hypothetical protein